MPDTDSVTDGSNNEPGSEVSARWARWRRAIDLADYDARWEQMLAEGKAAHGEADFVSQLGGHSVLDAGCGTGRVAIELAARGFDVVGVDLDRDMVDRAAAKAPSLRWVCADLANVDLGRQFDTVVMAGNVLLFSRPQDRSAIVANLARHVAQHGVLVAGFSIERGGYTLEEYDESCSAARLALRDRYATWERAAYSNGEYAVSAHAYLPS